MTKITNFIFKDEKDMKEVYKKLGFLMNIFMNEDNTYIE
jgi:hypothetical protein